MQRTCGWSQEAGLRGVGLETQRNNLGACRLHARCGFRLAGVDADLCCGLGGARPETALFWYWFPGETT